MVDAILRAARGSELIFGWRHVRTHIATLFGDSSPPSLNSVITFASPYIPWDHLSNTRNAIDRWAAAVSAVPCSEEVTQSAVDTLLWISGDGSRRSHIPVEMWALLKKRPPLLPMSLGRSNGTWRSIVLHIRGLGDIEILKSYFLLVWSEWNHLWFNGFMEMQTSIREDFDGIGMCCHRDDFIKHLNHVQQQLDRDLEYFKPHQPEVREEHIQERKGQYRHLKNVLLEVDKIAMESLTRMCLRLSFPNDILMFSHVPRIACNLHLCSASSVPMIPYLEPLVSLVNLWHQCFCPSPSFATPDL